jgi:Cu+-exporting ATPase
MAQQITPMNRFLRYFSSAAITLVLMHHMLDGFIHIHWLMNPWIQLALCVPVYIVGMNFFGRSAVKSLQNGMPNMNSTGSAWSNRGICISLQRTLLNLVKDTCSTKQPYIITLFF